jgi:hypothetical protein
MTYQQIIHKVPCPTCGAARGTACGSGAGRFRQQAHAERAANARGMMRASGNAISNLLAKLGFKR